ncbi:hypothetical protein BS47DRAFT_1287707 [Hydnum rufescens UP504]|uniref:Metallo-dependent hydrolase n=1 Tax=Hydnum rufescens UP504 TaxID=1448309 RepID=A0A9P6B905_9AGAM|nr:hypothetical protein BS47DRAFT_1287707 [Hydnum rufescens UP504]
MGKNRTKTPGEGYMHLPAHPSYSGSTCALIVDTHTHLLSTFASYREKYPTSKYETVFDFVRGIYCSQTPPPDIQAVSRHKVGAIIDVWCEAPIRKDWKELADSALTLEDRTNKWGGIEYYFVIGVHPHEAKLFNDAVEADILEALKHPRCVGYGEIGLDYHYNNSPPEVQRAALIRQLRTAVRLGKPLTIHTREADEDIERILKAEVPKNHLIHVHCFTDSVQLAANLLDYFPNLYIGVTGVITYSTNLNTSAVMRHLVGSGSLSPLRILLETDAPYMVPANLTAQTLSLKSGQKLPLSHSGMIPWTAEFVANVVGGEPEGWDAGRVLEVSRANARAVYGV